MYPTLEGAYKTTEKESALSHFDHDDVEKLKDFFTEEEFEWICTLALHKELVWEITLSLGQCLEEFYQNSQNKSINIVNYTSLLKLSSLEWIEKDAMPSHLRASLLKEIEKNKKLEITARNNVIQVLEEIDVEKGSFSSREKSIGIAIQSASLDKRDRKSWKTIHYLWYNKMLDRSDQNTFKKYFRTNPLSVFVRAAMMLVICPMIFYNSHVKEYHQDFIQYAGIQKTLENSGLAESNNFNTLAYYNNIGVDLYNIASYDSARVNFKRAQRIAEGQKLDNSIPKYNLNMLTYREGVHLYQNNAFARSIDSFKQLLGDQNYNFYKKIDTAYIIKNNDSLLLDAYNNIAVNYLYLGDDRSASNIRTLIELSDNTYFKRVIPNIRTLFYNGNEINLMDLQGYWQGILYEGEGLTELGRARPRYYFDLVIQRENDHDFRGTSQLRWLDDDKAFFITEFQGEYDLGFLGINEVSNPKKYKGYTSLRKNIFLRTYDNSDGKLTLVGEWQNAQESFSPDNRIILSKVSDDPSRR